MDEIFEGNLSVPETRAARRRRLESSPPIRDDGAPAFDLKLLLSIFQQSWVTNSSDLENIDDNEARTLPSSSRKKNRPISANSNALRLSSELIRLFITEAVQRAATIAEAEGLSTIEPSHLERILPQLLLDF